jgi:hypothetical protein
MKNEPLCELTAENVELLELGIALGQNHAFGVIAGRCSAAQAEGFVVSANRSYIKDAPKSGMTSAPSISR